jgi:hypothetical protein
MLSRQNSNVHSDRAALATGQRHFDKLSVDKFIAKTIVGHMQQLFR